MGEIEQVEGEGSPLLEGIYQTKEECGEGWDKYFSCMKSMRDWLRVTGRTPTSIQHGHTPSGYSGVFIKYD